MGINLLNDESEKIKNDFFDDVDIEKYETNSDKNNPLEENIPTEPMDIHPDLIEPIDESYDPANESKIKRYILPLLSIFAIVALVYFTYPFLLDLLSTNHSEKEIVQPIVEEKKTDVNTIAKTTIDASSERNAQLKFILNIFDKKSKDLSLSHVYIAGNEVIFESFSKNRDAFANLNLAMKSITENERFDVINSANRISPEGGIVNVFSYKSLKSIPLIYSELQSISTIKQIIQTNAQQNKLKTIELSEEKLSSKKTVFLQVQGSKKNILTFLETINKQLQNVSLQKFSLSSKDLKSMNENELYLSIRFNILE